MTKVKTALASESRLKRAADRRALGPLSSLLINARTLKRYTTALQIFFQWTLAERISLEVTEWELDEICGRFIDVCWQEGEAKGVAGDVLSALQHRIPSLKRNLNGSWRLFTAWNRHEMPSRAPPLPEFVALAIAGVLHAWQRTDAALLVALAFYGFMRTGEMCTLIRGQMEFAIDLSFVVLFLPDSKGAQRKGAPESILIRHSPLARCLKALLRNLLPGDRLAQREPAQFRVLFQAACVELGIGDFGYKPYSLRRGGASHHFRLGGNLSQTSEMGRWSDVRTARIYVTSAVQELNASLLPAQHKAVSERWAAFWNAFVDTF
jgi:integrase